MPVPFLIEAMTKSIDFLRQMLKSAARSRKTKSRSKMPTRLYYVHDPMCSWCWAFRPTWHRIRAALPNRIEVHNLLGGLAPDADKPMPHAMRRKIEGIWHTIEAAVPGTEFNFDFWTHCTPRRSTYPACRAVIAAKRWGPEHEEHMILSVQKAYYLRAMNPSDDSVLTALAGEIGIDRRIFFEDLNAPRTHDALAAQIAFARRIGARGFPSLMVERDGGYQSLRVDYLNPDAVLSQLR